MNEREEKEDKVRKENRTKEMIENGLELFVFMLFSSEVAREGWYLGLKPNAFSDVMKLHWGIEPSQLGSSFPRLVALTAKPTHSLTKEE